MLRPDPDPDPDPEPDADADSQPEPDRRRNSRTPARVGPDMRTRRRSTRLPALLAALAVLLAACGGAGTDDDGALGVDAGEGPLPEATFPGLLDPEETVSTSDWVGTPTVVNFWATWCAFCLDEMPALQEASERLDGRVRFVGIDRQDPRDDALEFLERTGVTYDQVASPDGRYFETVRARGMPTTLFVDAEGLVQYRHTGPLEL